MNAAVRDAVRKELPPARILDCTIEEYHRDPCESPSLSASTAHTMMSESPLHAWARHPKFAAVEDETLEADDKDTKAKQNGTIIHRLLLGKGSELVAIEANSFRSNFAKAARDEAVAAGKVPVLAHKLADLEGVAEHLRERCRVRGFEFKGGEAELPIQWYEHGAAGPVVCRSMIDYAWVNDGQAIDVKTIRSANPKQIARYFVDHGYDIQDRAYPRAIAQLNPKLRGRVELVFLFVELDPPYAVVPAVPDMALREVGKQRWSRAVSVWETCLAKNVWPSYCDSLITLEAPEWVIRNELGSEWAQ